MDFPLSERRDEGKGVALPPITVIIRVATSASTRQQCVRAVWRSHHTTVLLEL
jgi:hypothetical protein